MTNQETLQQMNRLKFNGMAAYFKAMLETHALGNQTIDQTISALIQAEWEERENKRLQVNMKNARFRNNASLEEINYLHPRNLDKNQMLRYFDCSFIKKAQNILVSGPTGCGKSYIISAIGSQACMMGYKVCYWNLQKLVSKLRIAKADGSYSKDMERIEKTDLLILDDYGLQPLDSVASMSLLEILEDRYGRKSTIMASQLPIDMWYEMCKGGKVLSDAIFDRLINGSNKIEMGGESMRKK